MAAAALPLVEGDLHLPHQAAAVAYADLVRRLQQVGVLPPRHVAAPPRQSAAQVVARAELHLAQIGHLDRRVAVVLGVHAQHLAFARQDRGADHRACLARLLQLGLVAFRVVGTKVPEALGVHAAETPGGVDAGVDRAVVAVGLEGGAGRGERVPVAGAVDGDRGANREAALLALEQGAAHRGHGGVLLYHRRYRPAVKQGMHAALAHQVVGGQLQHLGIDGRRPGHHAAVGVGARSPVPHQVGIAAAPVLRLGADDAARLHRAAVHELLPHAGHHHSSVPVGHAVDEADVPTGGQAPEVAVAFHQHGVRSGRGGADGRCRTARSTAQHQHVAVPVHRRIASRFAQRLSHPATIASPACRRLPAAPAAATLTATW